ncbi:MAG: hypothetical protein EOO01_10100, partial [Chitinophagaceae bacterium]
MQNILQQATGFFILIPLLAFLLTLFWKNKQERPIARIVQFTKAFYLVATIIYGVAWVAYGMSPVSYKLINLYQTDHFVFAIQFYYDQITAVYSLVGSILFFLVATFSRYYMHRDEGYKRFFNTILFFALGYNIIIFSGNFETLFIGWEIIGLSSFLLIAFYRNRYLPVKNAFKTLSNYRISDVALILAMWMMHHLTQQNISFTQLNEANGIALQDNHHYMAVFIVIMIVLSATIKSAQLPFTSWLPRSMEGPTTSSAIFYGSLSVHIGVFLLLRTWPFWADMLWARILIITIGLATGIVATLIARVQSTVKTQIAYASAAQIGIIFIEVALGWHILALIHFGGNAFLRTYQLLVSPSVLNYLVHHQYFHYHAAKAKPLSAWHASRFVLGVKEWNLDSIMKRFAWDPFKWIGKRFLFLGSKGVIAIVLLLALISLSVSVIKPSFTGDQATLTATTMLVIALALTLFTFSYRGSAIKAWMYLLLAHLFIIAGIGINATHIYIAEVIFYTSGIVIAFTAGLVFLLQTKRMDDK